DATVDPTVEPMPVVVDVPLTLDSMPMAVDALPKDIDDETVTVDAIPNQTYDAGKPITPTVTVRDGDAELTVGTDYTVSYDNNINAGTATVTITGMGNYTGSRTVGFTIEAKDIDFLKGHYSIPYTGSSIWADMMKDSKINIDFLRDGDYQLKYGVDFTMSGSAETSVGRLYSMDVFGIGNYTGYAGIDYSIVQLNLSNTDLVSADVTCTYNPADPAKPLVKATVYVGKQGYWGPYALPASDYTVTLSGNAGEDVRVTIEGIGANCTGILDQMVVVQALDLADAEVSLEQTSYTYEHSEIEPKVTVTYGGVTLTEDEDYTVSYANNINAGEAEVTIVPVAGNANIDGEKTVTFTIERKDIGFLKNSLDTPYMIPYAGGSYVSSLFLLELYDDENNEELEWGKDWDFSAAGSSGSAGSFDAAKLQGLGNYSGDVDIEYMIRQLNFAQDADIISADIQCYSFGGKIVPQGTVQVKGVYTLTEGDDYTLSCEETEAGVGDEVTVTISGIEPNCTGTLTKTAEVKALDLANVAVSFDGALYTYTGSEIKPKVTVTYGGVTLAEGTDYKVLYANNVNAGKDTATVTIKPADGNTNITGSKTVTFTIEARPIQLMVPGARYVIPYTGDLTMSLTFLKRYEIYDEGGRKLEFGKDYLPIAFNDQSVDVGSQDTAALKGIGNYTGSAGISYTIRQLDFAQDAEFISADIQCYSFGGKIVTQGTVHVHAATGNVLALTEGVDYTLSCEDTEANEGNEVTVTVMGIGNNCTGTLTKTVTVQPLTLAYVEVSLEKTLYAYDGSEHKPAVTVTYGGVTLIEDTDYTVSYANNTNAGTAIVIIEPVEGNTNIDGSKRVAFAIAQRSIRFLDENPDAPYTIPYTGTLEMSLSLLELYDGGKKLEFGKDWEPIGGDNQSADAGSTGMAFLEGKGNYTDTAQIRYEICQLNLEDVEVSLLQTSYTYDGSERKPEVIVTYGGVRLTEGRDYTVRYENNVNAGTAKVIIEPTAGNDNVTGSKMVEFTIERKDIGFLWNGPVDPHKVPYTGSSILYDMIMINDSKINLDFLCDGVYQLKYGVDYTIQPDSHIYILVDSLSNMMISGIGNYTGEAEIYYKTVQLDLSDENLVSADVTCIYNPDNPTEPLVKATVQVSQEGYWGPYTLPAEDYTVEYTLGGNGNVGDEVTVTIKPSGTGNCINQLQQTVTVQALNLANVAVSFEGEPYTYTGSEIKPEVIVTYGGVTLTEDEDYTVSYADNVNAGEATVTIEPVGGNDNIAGGKTVTFTIERKDIKFLSTLADNPYMIPYTGDLKASLSLLELHDEGKKLEFGKDYMLISFSGQYAGEGECDEAYLEGMGNYRGDARIYYMIRQLDFERDAEFISADIQCYSFGGKIVTQGTVQVHAPTGNVLALTEKFDYRLSCEVAEANVGDDVTVTITGTGPHCTGTLTQTVKVQALDLANVEVSLEKTSYAYDGSEHKPAVTVTYGGVTLIKDTDYTVRYANNVNAGKAKVTIQGIGNCCGTVEKSYTIAQQNLSGVTIAVEKCVFVGEDMAPELSVNVLADGVQLVEGIDYSLSVGSASEAGDIVQVLITAIGDNYTGELTKDAEVARRDVSDTTVSYTEPTFTYSGNANDLSAEDLSLSFQVGSEVVTYVRNVDYTVSYDDNVNVGTVTATIQGIGNLTGSFEKTFKIEQKSITSEGVTVDSIADQTYTGAAVTPEVIVRDGKTVLTKDKDYTVSYANNLNVGTASVTITGTGNYTVSVTAQFEIVARSITSEGVTVDSIADQTYTGAAVTPEVI
ncbi:MAG: hypothetical protein Q4E13_10485, partial [Clostridia bacterium]|nr:hypothetical protein [Clostridia bacterium]